VWDGVSQVSFRSNIKKLGGDEQGGENGIDVAYGEIDVEIMTMAFVKGANGSLVIWVDKEVGNLQSHILKKVCEELDG